MRTLGIIPARIGSKTVAKKNLRKLGGRPLIQWAAQAALDSEKIDRLICSADSEEILKVVRELGVETPFVRPPELAEDKSLVVDVMIHALKELDEDYDYVCLIQPTSPFVEAEDLDAAIDMAYQKEADTVICGYDCGQKHPSTMFSRNEDGSVNWFIQDKNRMARRQDLSQIYLRGGLVYVFRTSMLLNDRKIYGDRVYSIVVPEERAFSIDTEFDFAMAEFISKQLCLDH